MYLNSPKNPNHLTLLLVKHWALHATHRQQGLTVFRSVVRTSIHAHHLLVTTIVVSSALCGYKIFLTTSSSVFFENLKKNWKKIVIDQVLIHEQLGISFEGVVDVANATIQEAKFVLKWIACLNAFVENEQWSVIRIKKEFHPQFTTILQIFYQRPRLVYFNNHIAITFDMVNRT